MPLRYSPYIELLSKKMEELGWSVDLFCQTLPYTVGGRIHYHDGHIQINQETALGALCALAHEAGHAIHHNRMGRGLDQPARRVERERKAHLYGWGVLHYIKAPVTKEQWREEEAITLEMLEAHDQ